MIKQHILLPFFTLVIITLTSFPAFAAPIVGKAAPTFSGTDVNGQTISLSDYLGKIIVLEWTNHECPYVRKHYESGNMQALQKEATGQDIVWLTIVSSAPEKQGYTNPEEATAIMNKKGSHETTRILDPEGTIGRLYEARTTPHMFVINPEGSLAYMGAIDNMPSPDPETLVNAKNYVREAITATQKGELPENTVTRPYGCSIKY